MGSGKPRRRRGSKGKDATIGNEIVPSIENGVTDYKPHYTPLLDKEESVMWFETGKQIQGRNSTVFDTDISSTTARNSTLAEKYRCIAKEILKVELSFVKGDASPEISSSDARWVENTMKRGTLKDRIAATSVIISSDPVHRISTLDSLLSMAGCSDAAGQTNSRVAQMAAEALEDLFLNTLMPPDRKLLKLNQRPLALYEDSPEKTLSPRLLLLWLFEEILKDKYQSFIKKYLANTLKEGMESNKFFALRVSSTLLISCAEGEAQLLDLMVNKLGDPVNKIAAAAAHELRRVLDEHENMQGVVARDIQQLAHRPHLSQKALYNCIVFLNQLRLHKDKSSKGASNDSTVLPVSLVNTYFRMFDSAMLTSKGKSGMKSGLLSALLAGINRAHPYLPDDDQDLEKHIDSLYKVAHTAGPSASTQAMMLLFQVTIGSAETRNNSEVQKTKQNRFYRAVYSKLSNISFLSNGKHTTIFFNLLYKAMKNDYDTTRVIAFSKRLMSTAIHTSPPVAAAALFLLNELMKTHDIITKSFSRIPNARAATLELDPIKRDPSCAFGDLENGETRNIDTITPPLWESCLSSNHYHPSVEKFTSYLGSIQYAGDPLQDFSLSPFLDKFAYRNPKAQKKNKTSISQRRVKSLVQKPVNDPSFIKKDKFDAEDEFFHTFFLEQARRDKIKGISRNKKESDKDVDEEDGFEMLESKQVDEIFESGFSTDSEEEEFVDKLAMDLMDEAADADDDNLDDEDPDMEGWGDSDDNKDGNGDVAWQDDDDDNNDSDDSQSSQQDQNVDHDEFMDDTDSSDDEIPPAQPNFGIGSANQKKNKKSSGKNKDIFADAADYEHLITENPTTEKSKSTGNSRPAKKRRR